ncbi:MAG: serine hydrolase [Candidatus Latescibacterota bacterium]
MKHRSAHFMLSLVAFPLMASSLLPKDLPVVVSDEDWRPLAQSVDKDLQRKLEERLDKNKLWAFLLKGRKMAVGLVDITQPDSARFARINGSTMMYAASLPKIAILLAACQSFEDGTLQETPEIVNDLNLMIRKSSNQAATRVIDWLGYERIEAVLTDPRYKLFDPDEGGGLWVGKRYAKIGKRHPDPLKGLSHAATVDQVCRFYHLLATGRLVTPQRSRQMLEILSDPGLHHKFVNVLEEVAPQARLYRKSGTWKNWHSDSVLVWDTQWRRYILVGMVEHPFGENILKDLVLAIEEVLGH